MTESLTLDPTASTGAIDYYSWLDNGTLFYASATPDIIGYNPGIAGIHRITLTVYNFTYGILDSVSQDILLRETFEHDFDFTIDDGGFLPFVNVFGEDTAVYSPGVGWIANPAAVHTPNTVVIYRNIPTPTHLTQMRMSYSHTEDYPSGDAMQGGTSINPIMPPAITLAENHNSPTPETAGSYTFSPDYDDSLSVQGLYFSLGQFIATDVPIISEIDVLGLGSDPF